MNIIKRDYLLIILGISLTLFAYRPIFSGALLGDPFDARLMIVLHEHWFRWFHGLVEFRNTEFFYPYDTALGYSDVFLVQGIIYSLLRLIGFDLPNAWSLTTLGLLVVGNLGWVFLGKIFFQTKLILISFISTSILSLGFVYYFTFNPNIVGYAFLSWISILLISISKEKVNSKKQFKIMLFITIYLIYALSCWYGAFFLGIILFFYFVNAYILKKPKFKNRNFQRFEFSNSLYFFIPIQSFLIWLFFYVYVTVANQPDRPYYDLQRNSPKILTLANGGGPNGAGVDGSILGPLYKFLSLDYEFEYTIGIGIVVALLGLLSILYAVFLLKNILITHLIYAFTLSYLFFIQLTSTFSFHKIFFEHIPGFNSIRFPGRIVILIGFFLIFLIHLVLQHIKVNKKSILVTSLIYMLLLFTFVDQIRSPFKGWDKKLLTNEYLFSVKDEIVEKCDYFYFDYPGGWWYDQIEAITFSAQIGIPTVNGYSGAFPPNYPTEEFHSEKMPLKIFDWINKIDKGKRGCFITGVSPIRNLDRDKFFIEFIGFKNKEYLDADYWQWAVSPNPYLYIVNQTGKNIKITFAVQTTQCFANQKVRVVDAQDSTDLFSAGNTQGEIVEFTLDFSTERVKRLELIVSNEGCRVANDPRILFFNLKNFESTIIS